ncbi:hypothetical protein, partial [Sinorhizobium medicae]|uniref:hypothetical protein n=1 Tax=Sinorhizobium medicae TaxID=110321 RepID=UPI002B1BDA6D
MRLGGGGVNKGGRSPTGVTPGRCARQRHLRARSAQGNRRGGEGSLSDPLAFLANAARREIEGAH